MMIPAIQRGFILSGKRELHRQTEVVSGGWIAVARQQRRVSLTIKVGSKRQQARKGVIGHERELESRVSA